MLRHFLPVLLLSIFALAPTALLAVELPGSSVKRPLTERETFERGQAAYEQGQIDEALQHLRGFIIRYPQSSLSSRANLTLTRIFYQRHQFADARLYLARVADPGQTPEVELLQAALEIEEGNALGGVERLQQLAPGDLLPADRALRAKPSLVGWLQLVAH